MVDLSTKYMGFNLKNPIIAGSSGLCKSPEKVREFELNGAAAVVLKSIFEEQTMADTNSIFTITRIVQCLSRGCGLYSEFHKIHLVEEYMKLIRDCKKSGEHPWYLPASTMLR